MTEFTPASRVAAAPHMILRVEDDDAAILFDADSGEASILNPPAAAVFGLLDGTRTIAELVAVLREEFDGMGPEAEEQVLAAVRAFDELGAVRVVSP